LRQVEDRRRYVGEVAILPALVGRNEFVAPQYERAMV